MAGLCGRLLVCMHSGGPSLCYPMLVQTIETWPCLTNSQHPFACLQGSPEEILEAVAQGVDLFDCTYPTHATANGYALSFPLRPQDADDCFDPDSGADGTKLNLWSLQYRQVNSQANSH